MSTNSVIAMVQDDNKIKAIYCHWDGNLKWNGRILFNHYQDTKKIEQLIDLGHLSRLGVEIGKKHDFDTSYNKHPDWCCYYGRDRGEEDVEPRVFDNEDDLFDYSKNFGAEYIYLFKENKWAYLDICEEKVFIFLNEKNIK